MIICLVVFNFNILNLLMSLQTNGPLNVLRRRSWECYAELAADFVTRDDDDDDDDDESEDGGPPPAIHPQISALKLELVAAKRHSRSMNHAITLNQMNHVLVLIQNSKEGLKLGEIEISVNFILKLVSVMFSVGVIILRTADTTEVWGAEEGSIEGEL